jgi:hypothetical protein
MKLQCPLERFKVIIAAVEVSQATRKQTAASPLIHSRTSLESGVFVNLFMVYLTALSVPQTIWGPNDRMINEE